MSVRHWLISDGTAKHRGSTVPAGHGYQVVIWDGRTEWTPPQGAIAETEDAAKANKRSYWKPLPKAKPA